MFRIFRIFSHLCMCIWICCWHWCPVKHFRAIATSRLCRHFCHFHCCNLFFIFYSFSPALPHLIQHFRYPHTEKWFPNWILCHIHHTFMTTALLTAAVHFTQNNAESVALRFTWCMRMSGCERVRQMCTSRAFMPHK